MTGRSRTRASGGSGHTARTAGIAGTSRTAGIAGTSRTARTSRTAGTARIARIVERVRAIPEGFVRTYADIDPKAPRLVGRVLATTDEELPWHRVVRADGSAAVGATQLERLRREGVPVLDGRVVLAKARLPE